MSQSANRECTVFLNHFFLALDSATCRAIANSTFLKNEFAAYERRRTVRVDRIYTGQYCYGVNTYFEFFDVADEPTRQVGDSAIAFGVDVQGGLDCLERSMGLERDRTRQSTVTRELGSAQIPWFLALACEDLPRGSPLASWVMEYHPRFLAEWHPEADPNRGVTRREVLQRYKSVLENSPSESCLEDVVALTVALDPATLGRTVQWCQRLGYRLSNDGESQLLQNFGSSLRLIPSRLSVRGIVEARFQVRRVPLQATRIRFGPTSVLDFGDDGFATWSFC